MCHLIALNNNFTVVTDSLIYVTEITCKGHPESDVQITRLWEGGEIQYFEYIPWQNNYSIII